MGYPVALAAIPSKAMVLQLYISFFAVAPNSISCWALILLSSTL